MYLYCIFLENELFSNPNLLLMICYVINDPSTVEMVSNENLHRAHNDQFLYVNNWHHLKKDKNQSITTCCKCLSQGPGWRGCCGCSCTYIFFEVLILHPQILRKDDFYALDFHNFHSKFTSFSAFTAEECAIAFGPDSSAPGVESFSKFDDQ